MKSDGHITIEKTAKRFKGQLVLCWLGFIVGVCWIIGAYMNADIQGRAPEIKAPSILLICSAVWYLVTRVRIWWNHG